jgi:hypothetical protein
MVRLAFEKPRLLVTPLTATRTCCLLPAAILLAVASAARGQDVEPRAFSNAPVGVNFLIGGYAFTQGSLSFDPSLPVTNAQLNT